jgi:Uma2 family endonuclease
MASPSPWPALSLSTSRSRRNIVGELFQQLRGKNCRPLGSNQAVKLAASCGYVFPDVTVVCGKPEYIVKRSIGCLLNPSLVVEVLSSSTAALDQTDNLLAYTAMRTIREYLSLSGPSCRHLHPKVHSNGFKRTPVAFQRGS